MSDWIQSTLTTVWLSIAGKFTDTIAFIFNPLYRWYALFALFLVICMFLIWLTRLFDFEPMKWVRVVIGGSILLAFAFVLGGRKMYNDQQAKLKAEREKLKRKPPSKPPTPPWTWGS